MISFLSSKITKLLYEKEIIEEDKKEIYQYGFEIFISSLISLMIVLIIAILTGYILESIVFYSVFVLTRQYCGGYHAKTYLKCNIIFTIIYTGILLFSNIILDKYSLLYMCIFLIMYSATIWGFSPIENENKPLSEGEKVKNRRVSIVLSIIWIILSSLLFFVNKKLSIVFVLTLFSIAMLIFIEKSNRKEC